MGENTNIPEDEKTEEVANETWEDTNIPEDEKNEESEKIESLNTHEDEKKEIDSMENVTHNNENTKPDEVVELVNEDCESKGDTNIGIFITEDIEELVEDPTDVTDEVNVKEGEVKMCGTEQEQSTESKEHNETESLVDNETREEQPDHLNEKLIQIQKEEEQSTAE